jgi:hypothetical protein
MSNEQKKDFGMTANDRIMIGVFEKMIIAESLFPGSDHHAKNFFLETAKNIFVHLLEFNPTPDELIRWLISEEEIDKHVEGTELAHLINAQAPQQRGGVLGTLWEVGNKLKLLREAPERVQGG